MMFDLGVGHVCRRRRSCSARGRPRRSWVARSAMSPVRPTALARQFGRRLHGIGAAPTITTWAPWSTNCRAMAKPMPLLPPVTTATFPASVLRAFLDNPDGFATHLARAGRGIPALQWAHHLCQPVIHVDRTPAWPVRLRPRRGSGLVHGRRAALGTTPSAVSKSIARLEARLGVKLFHRSTRACVADRRGAGLLRARGVAGAGAGGGRRGAGHPVHGGGHAAHQHAERPRALACWGRSRRS